MEINGNDIKQKISKKYVCDFCNYITVRKSNYETHLLSAKHKMEINGNENKQKISKNNIECELCHKTYQTLSGLWKHKTNGKCRKEDTTSNNSNQLTTLEPTQNKDDLILMLITQNSQLIKETAEFKSMMMKVMENGTNYNSNNTTNSHNKAFNLQFFLNETCKDAMNMTDFIDSIQLQLSDLERMEEIGFVEGISNIIIKKLNALDVSKRPIHCTDKKRETIYIKDQGIWEKDEENTKLRSCIKKVAGKNARLLQVFKEKHPDYNQYHSKYSTQYNKLVIEAFGGKGDNEAEKEDKIIRNITKTILIEK